MDPIEQLDVPRRLTPLQFWLIHSTVFCCLFVERFGFKAGISIRLDYFVLLFNLFVLFLNKQFRIPAWILAFFSFLLASGVYGTLFGMDTPTLFLKEFLGIVFFVIYNWCFFRALPIPASKLFDLYVRYSYYAAILALVTYPFFRHFQPDARLCFPMLEPSTFVGGILAAYYYCASEFFSHGLRKKETIVFTIAFFLSNSSVGYIGLLLGAFLLMRKRGITLLIAPVVSAGFFAALYTLNPAFQTRMDGLFTFLNGDPTGTNLSTGILIICAYAAWQAFLHSPVMGMGLGSFSVIHDTYGGNVNIVNLPDYGYISNADDAASLFLRLLGETGILGLGVAFYYFWRFWIPGRPVFKEMSVACFLYFLINLLRNGIYFWLPTFFLYFMYQFLYREWQADNQRAASLQLASELLPE